MGGASAEVTKGQLQISSSVCSLLSDYACCTWPGSYKNQIGGMGGGGGQSVLFGLSVMHPPCSRGAADVILPVSAAQPSQLQRGPETPGDGCKSPPPPKLTRASAQLVNCEAIHPARREESREERPRAACWECDAIAFIWARSGLSLGPTGNSACEFPRPSPPSPPPCDPARPAS